MVKEKSIKNNTTKKNVIKIKLYQEFSGKQIDSFLKTLGTSLKEQELVEIMSDEQDLFGDFIVTNGYKFKKIYDNYSCMETPTEKHIKIKKNWPKAANDYYKK